MQLTWRNGLDAAEATEVMNVLDRAEVADGVAPAGEQVIRRLKAHRDLVDQIEPVQADVRGSEHFVVRDSSGELAGYAHVDTENDRRSGGDRRSDGRRRSDGEQSSGSERNSGDESSGQLVAELGVDPRRRRQGVGTRLVQALLERAELLVEPDADTGRLRIWSHGEHPGALRLAERFGFARSRELWRMGRAVAGSARNPSFSSPDALENQLPEVGLPADTAIRSFRAGADESAVVRVNQRAFRWHPEQGAMTEAELRAKEHEEWFDSDGFLLAVDSRDRLLGFHWTKIHPDGIGEVYVVGVDPDAQGRGLGRALTVAGVRHLRDAGCASVMLYVEADNAAAIAVYKRLGFQRWDVDVQFGR